jgi:type II secretory ATPase GspE/PulE/Tfp pilus assembly ATPase PilB-like protein
LDDSLKFSDFSPVKAFNLICGGWCVAKSAIAFVPTTTYWLMIYTSPTDSATKMNSDQIFPLIDTVVPFEACLYYQVLPLSLEGNILKLGVVDAQDDSALDYVQRILAYMNCSVTTEAISSETQHSMLSAYLLHGSQPREAVPTATAAAFNPINPTIGKTTETSQPKVETVPSEPELESVTSLRFKPSIATIKPAYSGVSHAPIPLQTLDIQALHLSSPMEVLTNLPAPQLLQELLGRILLEGIGRLFFERQQLQGRILWSQDGVLKSMLEGIQPLLFQEVIDELKRLTDMPLSRVQHAQQVEVERIYQETHLLLRLRVMPANGGEEATLQVLRGAALRFYEQQQLSTLSRDALRLAQELQRKVNQIRDRTRLAPLPLEGLPALEEVIRNVDYQIEALMNQHHL